jgi:hypothetical protein
MPSLPLIGAIAGGAAGAVKGLGALRNIGAPEPQANPFGPLKTIKPTSLTQMRMGAQQAASYNSMSPLELRREVQGSLLAPAPVLANAMQAGWKPSAMQSMALPRDVRRDLNQMGYNAPGIGQVAGPVALGAIGGLLAGAVGSRLTRDQSGNTHYTSG